MNSIEDQRQEAKDQMNRWLKGCSIPEHLITNTIIDMFMDAFITMKEYLASTETSATKGPAKMVAFLSHLLATLPKDLPQRRGWMERRALWIERVSVSLEDLRNRGSGKGKPCKLINVEHTTVKESETVTRTPTNVVHLPPFVCLCDAPSTVDGLDEEVRK